MIELVLIGCDAVVHQMYAKTIVGRRDYSARYLYDINDAQATSAAETLGGRAVSLAELLEKADAIVVTTPPSTHAAIVRKCLRTDRIILCEKPFVTTHAEAVAEAKESRAAGARLYVSQFRRTFPQLQVARQIGGILVKSRSEDALADAMVDIAANARMRSAPPATARAATECTLARREDAWTRTLAHLDGLP